MNFSQNGKSSVAAHPQQKRLQARCLPSQAKPEEKKSKKTTNVDSRVDDNKDADAFRHTSFSTVLSQNFSRQEQLTMPNKQSSYVSNQHVSGGSSFTNLGVSKKRTSDQVNIQAASKKQQLFKEIPNQAISGSLEMSESQKQASQGRRQARTTHHSRQISWNQDQSHDLTNPTAKASFNQQILKNNDESHEINQQQITAAQQAHKSQKIKMTQNILKRLKESIDQSNFTTNTGVPPSSLPSSILPSQISDAYQNSKVKNRAESYATTAIPSSNNTATGLKLSTIVEQNSNQKLVKTQNSQTVEVFQQKKSVRTSSTAVNKAHDDQNSVVREQEEARPRKVKSRDNTVQAKIKHELASPQIPYDVRLIPQVRQSVAVKPISSLTQSTNPKKASTAAQSSIQDGSTHPNPYATEIVPKAKFASERVSNQEQNVRETLQQQRAVVKHQQPANKSVREKAEQFKASASLAEQPGHITVKKAHITPEAVLGVAPNKATINEVKVVKTSKPQASQILKGDGKTRQPLNVNFEILQAFAQDQEMKRANAGIEKTKTRFSSRKKNLDDDHVDNSQEFQISSTLQEAKPLEQVIKKNQRGNKSTAKDVQKTQLEGNMAAKKVHLEQQHGKKQKTTIVSGQIIPASSVTISQILFQKGISKIGQIQDTRVPRKAKTTYSRTPASYRSTSGGKPQTQLAIAPQTQVGGDQGQLNCSPQAVDEQLNQKKAKENAKQGAVTVGKQVKALQNPPKSKTSHKALSNKTRQSKISTQEQPLILNQAISQPQQQGIFNAPSFGSLYTSMQYKNLDSSKQNLTKSIDSYLLQGQTKKGTHKRSISYKQNENALSLIQSNPLGQIPGAFLHGTTQQSLLQKKKQPNILKFNINYEKLLQGLNQVPTKDNHLKIVSPFRTKQPSINNSRRISKEREISKNSNSVQSPKINKSGKGGSRQDGGAAGKTAKTKLHQNSFLTKANCKSMDSSSGLFKSQDQNKEIQKLLKNIIKKGIKNSQPSVEKSSKTTKPSIMSQSGKSNQLRQLLMRQVLGGQGHSSVNDDDTMAGGQSLMETTFNNQRSTKDQRTFQERHGGEQILPHQSSIMAGFAPDNSGSQKQFSSALIGNEIISGTFIATNSNQKINVYPEEVKEKLLQYIPTKRRVSRVPTTKQLQASSFENQVTMKRGDQLNQPIEHISVLDDTSQKQTETPQSDDKQIFQAFDEYLMKEQQVSGSAEIDSGFNSAKLNEPIKKRGKLIDNNTKIKQFVGTDSKIIDFHPNQKSEEKSQSSDPESHYYASTRRNEQNLFDDEIQVKMLQEEVAANTQLKEEEEDSSEYDSEIYQSEVFDPLLEDKQYLVTMIVTHFQETGAPVPTSAEFYRIGNQLGEGAFGKVCIAQHKLTGHFTAVKCLRKRDLNKQSECKKKVAQDMQILQHLTNHKNVVKLYDSFETKSHICFVMELCAGGDLLSFVRRRKKLDEKLAKFLFKQTAKGLAYCHRNRVLHRDIKLENLLIDEEGTVKICDFGVSQLLNDPTDLVKDQCGTPAYMAPEVFQCTNAFSGQKADVWSLGVCLFAMLCGMVPYRGRNIDELKQSITRETLKYPGDAKKKLSREARNLIKIMLRKNPKERATIDQVLRHPWLQSCPKQISVFSQSELNKIKVLSQPACGSGTPQRLLTEVELTQRSLTESQKLNKHENGSNYSLDYGHKVNNITEKSVVLAPFNSTITQSGFENFILAGVPFEDVRTIKFADKVREPNRQYEFNYNGEVDNGIMISVNKSQSKKTLDIIEQKEPQKKQVSKTETNGLIFQVPQVSVASSSAASNKPAIDVQSKNVIMSGIPDSQAPMISRASLASEEFKIGEGEKDLQVFQPVINFNGMKQIGYMVPPSERSSLSSPPAIVRAYNDQGIISAEQEPPPSQEEESDDSLEEQRRARLQADVQISFEASDDENYIDNLIVCKIENEFGYPEEYLLDCLKNDRKNDATTCYYLFCKEDKNEIVNLLGDSPDHQLPK